MNNMPSKFSDVAVWKLEDDRLGFKEYAEGVIATIEHIEFILIGSQTTPKNVNIQVR